MIADAGNDLFLTHRIRYTPAHRGCERQHPQRSRRNDLPSLEPANQDTGRAGTILIDKDLVERSNDMLRFESSSRKGKEFPAPTSLNRGSEYPTAPV
jgi:hypothetical protein